MVVLGSCLRKQSTITSLEESAPLPNASTFCGRCEEVCPMGIPLPELLRQLRNDQVREKITPELWLNGFKLYHWLCMKPTLYHWAMRIGIKAIPLIARFLPRSKTQRTFPIPSSDQTFMDQWKHKQS